MREMGGRKSGFDRTNEKGGKVSGRKTKDKCVRERERIQIRERERDKLSNTPNNINNIQWEKQQLHIIRANIKYVWWILTYRDSENSQGYENFTLACFSCRQNLFFVFFGQRWHIFSICCCCCYFASLLLWLIRLKFRIYRYVSKPMLQNITVFFGVIASFSSFSFWILL